jgi:hypothetical protein
MATVGLCLEAYPISHLFEAESGVVVSELPSRRPQLPKSCEKFALACFETLRSWHWTREGLIFPPKRLGRPFHCEVGAQEPSYAVFIRVEACAAEPPVC